MFGTILLCLYSPLTPLRLVVVVVVVLVVVVSEHNHHHHHHPLFLSLSFIFDH
jgi:hypothetical protein